MAVPYLVITDLVTTCTIFNTSGGVGEYALEQWTPAIAGLRRTKLAGIGPYEDVVEEMRLSIIDTTAAGCYTRLQTLNTLLDQAERWYNGENVAAVLLKYAPAGATVSTSTNPLQAAILGRALGNQTSGVGIEPKFDAVNYTYMLPVTVRFWRRGLWLHITTSANSGSVNNGSLATVDLAAAVAIPGPTKITMSNYPSTGGTDEGVLLVSSNDAQQRLSMVDVSGGTATGWSSVNDSANFAQFTNVLRYTPSAIAESSSGAVTVSPALASGSLTGLIGVWLLIRNNSSSVSFRLRVLLNDTSGLNQAYSPLINIPPYSGASAPRWSYMLAPVGLSTVASLVILATASSTSGSPTIDFGAVALMDMRYPFSYALTYKPTMSNASTKSLIIDHALLSLPEPTTFTGAPFSVKGDRTVMTVNRNINIINLITRPGANDWRQTNSTPAVNPNTLTLARYDAYLTPR